LCAAQALDLFTNVKPGEGTLAAYSTIRDAIPYLESDRILAKDIDAVKMLMRSGKILDAVERKVGIIT
jgi:histidine ammonia-lyase